VDRVCLAPNTADAPVRWAEFLKVGPPEGKAYLTAANRSRANRVVGRRRSHVCVCNPRRGSDRHGEREVKVTLDTQGWRDDQ
jgi:hypothetical protein